MPYLDVATQSHTKSTSIATLRASWNAFSRLLDINFHTSFLCPVCGAQPSTMICDGTMLGFHKDLISCVSPHSHPQQSASPPLAGSNHQDRVLLKSPRSRELLLKYAGITRGRKKVRNPKQLTQSEMKTCSSISRDGFVSLVELINRLTTQTGERTCPEPYREFLSEISRNSPACGLLQLGDNREVIRSLQKLVQNSINILDTSSHHELSALQAHAPLIADFVCKCPKSPLGKLPQDVCDIVAHIEKVQQTYAHPLPQSRCYPSVTSDCDKWSFFPSLPIVRGRGTYAADHGNAPQSIIEDACRKASYGHLTLTPGIFTVYCPHGVCYGFQAMRSCESPQYPFDIFTFRFHAPPRIIIYDNTCKLHIYCLNREPARCSNTRFFVDSSLLKMESLKYAYFSTFHAPKSRKFHA